MTDRPAAPASKQPETELLKPDEPLNSNSLNLVDQVGTGGAKAPKPSAEPSEIILLNVMGQVLTPMVGVLAFDGGAMVREILAERKETEAAKLRLLETVPKASNHPTPLRDTSLPATEPVSRWTPRRMVGSYRHVMPESVDAAAVKPEAVRLSSRALVAEAILHQPAARSWDGLQHADDFVVKRPALNIEEFTVASKSTMLRGVGSVLGAAAINTTMDYTAFAGVPTSDRTMGWDIASQFIYALPRGGLLAKGGAVVAQHWLNREIDRGQQEETNADELAPLAIVPRKIDDVFAKALLESQRRYSTIESHQSRISKDNREAYVLNRDAMKAAIEAVAEKK